MTYGLEFDYLPCPFCNAHAIECMHKPGVWGEKRGGRNSLGSGKSVTKSADVWLIKTGCSTHNKTPEEVERELKRRMII